MGLETLGNPLAPICLKQKTTVMIEENYTIMVVHIVNFDRMPLV